jgi:hypothetical protein
MQGFRSEVVYAVGTRSMDTLLRYETANERQLYHDLGKTTFHLVALGERGEVVLKRKFTRKSYSPF